MIEFSKIFGVLPTHKRIILFEEGSWCIYKRESTDQDIKLWNSSCEINILHDCSTVAQEDERRLDRIHTAGLVTRYQLKLGNAQCDRCDEIPPNHIQAMYLMLEWDKE